MNFKCAYKELVSVELLKMKRHPRNPNKHPKNQIEQLSRIINYQGQRTCIVVSNRSGFITKGHGRLEAIDLLEWKEGAVDFQDYDDEAQEWADIVADNAIALQAELDLVVVNEESLKLKETLNIDMLGLRNFQLVMPDLIPSSDPNGIPTVAFPITVKGDVWILGKHRLVCGDSTDVTLIQKLMAGTIADMVLTDPPYNMQMQGGTNQKIGKNARSLGDKIDGLVDFEPEAFLNTLPTVFHKKIMNAYVFCNKDLVPQYLNWAVDNGYSFNILFWKKPNGMPLGDSHRPDVEYLLLFRKSATWNNGLKDVNYSKCLEYNRDALKDHPTVKPVEMLVNEIKISSRENGIVVDFFAGSGSTLIACEMTNRICNCIEIEPKYCDVIINRYQKFTGNKVLLEESNQTYDELKEIRKGKA